MEYIVTIDYTAQVTEDSWKLFKQTLKINQDTTMKEIHEWVNTREVRAYDTITITPCETLTNKTKEE